MFDTVPTTQTVENRGWRTASTVSLPGVSDDVKRHFREQYPLLLDGALVQTATRRDMGRYALEALTGSGLRAGTWRHSRSALREALDSPASTPRPKTAAGLAAVNSRNMWVWWDAKLLALPDDILAATARPRPILRFYDITGLPAGSDSWNQTFDLDADLAGSGRLVDFWAADRAYLVDLGLLYADGRFLRLARTNPAALPREFPGAPGTGITRVTLEPPQGFPPLLPDDEAKAWFDAGPDWPARDRDAELALRMLYRAFLAEGPRALRRAGVLTRGDPSELEREHRYRGYRRAQRAAAASLREKARTAAARGHEVFVALLDARAAYVPEIRAYPLARLPERKQSGTAPAKEFGFYAGMLRVARTGIHYRNLPVAEETGANVRGETTASPETATALSRLVRPAPLGMQEPFAWRATSIFETAHGLNRDLARLTTVAPPGKAADATILSVGASPDTGGSEGRRLARAGIRLSRLSLTLEGQARPGARFKVAGKLVQADRDGRFRVECVVSGKKARIPLCGVAPVGGEARSVVAIEWKNSNAGKREKAAAR